MPRVGGKCLIFDGFSCHTDALAERFGLLAVVEVFRTEMEFARRKGVPKLISRLRSRGHHPYSDLDRPTVA
jgi:hypothetical protein